MESGYEEGLDPDVYVNEFIRYADSESPFFDMGTLGDYENEYQLNVAMHSLFPDIPLMSTKTSLTRSVDCNLTTIVMVPERGLSLGRVVVP